MVIIKKYSNRRLYDTRRSGYITLDELADTIRGGTDVQVLDAKTGADLTQPTLAQIILDSRGAAKLLPPALLTQLIRMGDEALAEFFGKYMSLAMELYLAAKRGAQAVSPYFPLATMPFSAADAMARLLGGQLPWRSAAPPPPADQPPAPGATQVTNTQQELATLRAEIAELRRAVHGDGDDG